MKTDKAPKVSVVIPCYNQGKYLNEAVNSVLKSTYPHYEIIIVNDGSTDGFTNQLLHDYNKPKCKVLKTSNQGLSEARNNGIRTARGEYILPLDADDRISSQYIEKAVSILEQKSDAGIVYSRVKFFGIMHGEWKLPTFTLQRMLKGNIIICSAFFRKDDWAKVGGYDKRMKYGCQDWDLWLSFLENGVGVYQIPEIHFYYRIRKNSMARTTNAKNFDYINKEIFNNHKDLYLKNMPNPVELLRQNAEYERLMSRIDHKFGRWLFIPLFYIRQLFYTLSEKISLR